MKHAFTLVSLVYYSHLVVYYKVAYCLSYQTKVMGQPKPGFPVKKYEILSSIDIYKKDG